MFGPSSPKRSRTNDESLDKISVLYTTQKIVKPIIGGMKKAMRTLGVKVVDDAREGFNHLVTGFDCEEDVWKKLEPPPNPVTVVSAAWHADCIKAGRLLPTEGYQLPTAKPVPQVVPEISVEEPTEDYGCQRITPLIHFNKDLADALEILEEDANFRDSEEDYSRALAFRNASCVLKSLTFRVTRPDQVQNKKDIGSHCLKVIKEVLSSGFSSEVEKKLDSEWFQTMRLYVGLFGVGPSTANKWFQQGCRTMTDVLTNEEILKKRKAQLATGLAYHADLAMPVQRSEAEAWRRLIYSEVQKVAPGTTVEITGGFRRGKSVGHDIDLLISHPEAGKECGLLPVLMATLQKLEIVIYGGYEKSTYTDKVLQDSTKHTPLKSTLDHFEKWIGVVRMNSELVNSQSNKPGATTDSGANEFIPNSLRQRLPLEAVALPETLEEISAASPATVKETIESVPADRDWVARRVDLIIAPASQYYYALVGWTGSKHFNRSARNYAWKELKLKLSSHGLWDPALKQAIPAASEKEVFENLKLKYREPWERNC